MDIKKGSRKADNTNNWMLRGKEKKEEQWASSDGNRKEAERNDTVLVQQKNPYF